MTDFYPHPWEDPRNYDRTFEGQILPPGGGIWPEQFPDQYQYQQALRNDQYVRQERAGSFAPTSYSNTPKLTQWAPGYESWALSLERFSEDYAERFEEDYSYPPNLSLVPDPSVRETGDPTIEYPDEYERGWDLGTVEVETAQDDGEVSFRSYGVVLSRTGSWYRYRDVAERPESKGPVFAHDQMSSDGVLVRRVDSLMTDWPGTPNTDASMPKAPYMWVAGMHWEPHTYDLHGTSRRPWGLAPWEDCGGYGNIAGAAWEKHLPKRRVITILDISSNLDKLFKAAWRARGSRWSS